MSDDIDHSLEKLDAHITKIVSYKTYLIFAATTPIAMAVTKATKLNKIPAVFGTVNDPVSVESSRSNVIQVKTSRV